MTIRTLPVDAPFDPALIIAETHHYAELLGYKRTRLDQGKLYVDPSRQYEIGYGCGEVVLRTSHEGRYTFHRPWSNLMTGFQILLVLRRNAHTWIDWIERSVTYYYVKGDVSKDD